MRSLVRTALGLTLGLTLLTGCSSLAGLVPGANPSTSAAGTTTDQGGSVDCGALGEVLTEAASTLPQSLADAGSDPEAALQALTDLTKEFGEAAATVDNAEVKAQAQSTLDALNALVTAADAASQDSSQLPGLATAFAGVQEELGAIGTLCG